MTRRTIPITALDDTAARAVRAGLDAEHADRLAAAIKAGRPLPDVLAIRHGERLLVYDGAHRLEGYRRALPLLVATLEIGVEVTGEGGPAEALALALGCNQAHGLPLSRADLQHRRELVLTAEEERVRLTIERRRSSRDLAAVIGCSHTYVTEWWTERGIGRARKPPVNADSAPAPRQQLITGGEVPPSETTCPAPSPLDASLASPSVARAPVAPLATAGDCGDSATVTATPTSTGPSLVTVAPEPADGGRPGIEDAKTRGAGVSSTASPATTEAYAAVHRFALSDGGERSANEDEDEDAMLGEALDEARERIKALEAKVADLGLREGIQHARADGWQRKAEIAQESADKLVSMQHRLDAAIDRERQAIARAERAEAGLIAAQRDAGGWPDGWTLDTMARLPCWRAPRDSEGHRGPSAVVYEVAGGGYEAAMETPDHDTVEGALELLRRMAWGLAGRPLAAPDLTEAEIAAVRARFEAGTQASLERQSQTWSEWVETTSREIALEKAATPESAAPRPDYRAWSGTADELVTSLHALPADELEWLRREHGVRAGERLPERLTLRIMRDARAA